VALAVDREYRPVLGQRRPGDWFLEVILHIWRHPCPVSPGLGTPDRRTTRNANLPAGKVGQQDRITRQETLEEEANDVKILDPDGAVCPGGGQQPGAVVKGDRMDPPLVAIHAA